MKRLPAETEEANYLKQIKNMVRTKSGRPGLLITQAEDEFETVGLLEYPTGIREVRRRHSYNTDAEAECCLLGACDVYKNIFKNTCTMVDCGHIFSRPHPRVECTDGVLCSVHLNLLEGGLDVESLGHCCIYSHPTRTWTNLFHEGFLYFVPLQDFPTMDPVHQYCAEFNDLMWNDAYCEDYKDQTAVEKLQELLIEIRENGFADILRTPNEENITGKLHDFMNSSQYLAKYNNPLLLHHVLGLSLIVDTPIMFEYNNAVFQDGYLDTKWKHLFCTLMEATEILARLDPLVGEHVHCSVEDLHEVNTNCAIRNFIVGSRKRNVVEERFPEEKSTIFDMYIPHRHHKTNDSSICGGVANVSWLSRFPGEDLVLIQPGQCLIVENIEKGEMENIITGYIRGNNHLREGKEPETPFVEEITINFGVLSGVLS